MIADISKGEARLVAFSFSQSFLIGIPRVFTAVAANAIFLEHFTPAEFAYGYTIGALVVFLIGASFVRLQRRVTVIPSVLTAMAFMALVVGGLRVAVDAENMIRVAAFALLVWCEVEWALTQLAFWSVANHMYTVRQAKRLFGLISTGELVPTIAGGLAVPALVSHLGVSNLLYLSLVAHLFAAGNLYFFRPYMPKNVAQSTSPSGGPPLRTAMRDKYLLLVGGGVTLNILVYYFVDNAFFHVANARFPAAEELAAFIGHMFVAVGAANLLFRGLVSARWTERVGLRGALLTTPIAIGVLAAMVVAFAKVPALVGGVFVATVIMRVVERTAVGSIYVPSHYTLFQPLSPSLRARAQSAVDTLITAGAGLLAGGVLIVLNEYLGFTAVGLAAGAVLLTGLWAAVAFATGKAYLRKLGSSLTHRDIDPAEIDLNDPTSLKILEEGLSSAQPAMALYCAELLVQCQHERLTPLLVGMLTHPSPLVRNAACMHLETAGDESAVASLHERFKVEPEPSCRAAILRASVGCDPIEGFELASHHMKNPDLGVRQGAISGLLRYGGIEGAVTAGPYLIGMTKAKDVAQRYAAAATIGDVGVPNFFRGLLPLLEDESLEVREAAIVAARRLDNRRLWPAIARQLSERKLRSEAATAMMAAGDEVTDVLREVFAETGSATMKLTVLRICGRIRGERSVALLLEQLQNPDRDVFVAAVRALNKVEYVADEASRGAIEAKLKEGAKVHDAILATRRDLAPLTNSQLLVLSLDQELDRVADTMLSLLGFLYVPDTFEKVRDNLAGDERRVALAIELLEGTVSKSHAELVMPAIEAAGSKSHRAMLLQTLPPSLAVPSARLRQLLGKESGWRTPWLQICGIDVAAHNDIALPDSEDEQDPEEAHSLTPFKSSGMHARRIIKAINSLRAGDLFSEVPVALLATTAAGMKSKWLPADTRMLVAGETVASAYYVRSGVVTVGEQRFEAGSWVAALAALRPHVLSEDLVVVERAELLELKASDVAVLFDERFAVAWAVLQALCDRFRDAAAVASPSPAPRSSSAAPGPRLESNTAALEKTLALRTIPLLSTITDSGLAKIASLSSEHNLRKDDVLVAEGDLGTSMFLILDGQMRVEVKGDTVDTISAPNVLGELAAIRPAPRTATIVANTRSRVLVLEQRQLYDLLWNRGEVLAVMIDLLVSRLQRSGEV